MIILAAGQTYSDLLEEMIKDRKKLDYFGIWNGLKKRMSHGVPVVAFQIIISKRALEFIEALPPKRQRIVIERSKTLAEDPFPGRGDREQIKRKGHKDIYRLHISRS